MNCGNVNGRMVLYNDLWLISNNNDCNKKFFLNTTTITKYRKSFFSNKKILGLSTKCYYLDMARITVFEWEFSINYKTIM